MGQSMAEGNPIKRRKKRMTDMTIEETQSPLIQTKPEKKSKYMVFVEGEGLPTVKQPDFKSAWAAAKKLTEKFPDRKVMVLHHCKTFQARSEYRDNENG